MTPAFLPALGGAMVVAGLIGIVVGLQKVPPLSARPQRRAGVSDRLALLPRRTRVALAVGLAVGVGVALSTGWLIAVIALPAAVVGVPALLSTPPSAARIDRLEAMEEWARSLSSGLTEWSPAEWCTTDLSERVPPT